MSLIFMDGFGHYDTAQIADKWRNGAGTDCAINTVPGNPRTGRGCMQLRSAAFGPIQAIPQLTNVLCATNWASDNQGGVLAFQNTNVSGGFNGTVIHLFAHLDGSISVYRGPTDFAFVLGTTAVGLVQLNATYNSIAMQVVISPTVGSVRLWINGVVALNLTNINTTHPDNPALVYMNAVQLLGPGGIPTCFHADVYMLDCSTSPNITFLGALRIYDEVPTADSSPIQWTPLSGSNFANVAEVPPDGDTSYNSAASVGLTDQYLYPDTSIPANSTLFMVQHTQDMKVDSGSRSVAGVMEGVTNSNSNALTNGYVMFWDPYDVNPATGVSFTGADFPLSAGPTVTA